MDLHSKTRFAAVLGASLLSGCMASHQPIRHPSGADRSGFPLPTTEPIFIEDIEITGRVEVHPIAQALKRPSIGVIGPSDVYPGHIAEELQRILREQNPESVSKSYGIGGQDSALILKRFKKQIVECGHNLVVISGLTIVNEYDQKNIYENFPKMFDIAKEAGIPIIVYGPTPFASLSKWNPNMQKRADKFDQWLRAQEGITYVDTSSLGTPIRPGGPLKLIAKFDSGDGIHPSAEGARETARLIFENALKPHLAD